MEKVNDILKTLIGIILVFSFVIAFASCENNQVREDRGNTDTTARQNQDTTEKRRDYSEESKAIEVKLDSLREKAKRKGGKVEEEIKQALNKLNAERKEILSDSTSERMEENWDQFKYKTKNLIDTLEKKF